LAALRFVHCAFISALALAGEFLADLTHARVFAIAGAFVWEICETGFSAQSPVNPAPAASLSRWCCWPEIECFFRPRFAIRLGSHNIGGQRGTSTDLL
jgi:hypothetical protein